MSSQSKSWQQTLKTAWLSPEQTLDALGLSAQQHQLSEAAAQQFASKIPKHFVAKMQSGDLNDPLLRQVLPVVAEEASDPSYACDPLAEQQHNPQPGILHKYHGRVLLILSTTCAIHCRYCFRRHFDYGKNRLGRHNWPTVFDYIKQDESIREVIFSGGDPLLVNDRWLAHISRQLASLQHVKTLRIHSRIPIVLPERLTQDLLTSLGAIKIRWVWVIHCNHPREIDTSVANALRRLKGQDILLLNQAVLLKGVNDDADTLCELSEKLFTHGVLPYYMHSLDAIAGTAHFAVSDERARLLEHSMRSRLPGYLVPKWVREESYKPYKQNL